MISSYVQVKLDESHSIVDHSAPFCSIKFQLKLTVTAIRADTIPAIGIVSNVLWIHLTTPHVFNVKCQPFTVLYILIGKCFDIGLLYFGVLSPDYFTTAVHRHGWFFTSKLK
jgi:hypothetical protein